MIRIRKIQHFVLALFVGLSACAIEDETGPRPDEVFVKYFGASGSQQMIDMIIEPDSGNVVLLGKQTLAGLDIDGNPQDGNIIVIKADTNGNEYNRIVISMSSELFTRGDTNAFQTEDNPASIINAVGGGFLVAGSFNEIVDGQLGDGYLFWLRLSDDLDVIKSDTIQSENGVVEGGYIVQTSDNNVAILGSTTQKAVNDLTPNAGYQYLLIKRDFNADTSIFKKTFGYANSDEFGRSLFETVEGNLTIIGQTDRIGSNGGAGGQNVSVMILNPLATAQLSAKEYGVELNGALDANDQPADAIQNSSGYVVVGTTSLAAASEAFLMGISNSGGLIFQQQVDSDWGINSTGASVAQTRESDLFVVGSYPDFTVLDDPTIAEGLQRKNGEVMVMRRNPFGKRKTGLESNFGLVGGNDEANKVLRLASGAMLVGATIDFGSGQQMMALKKMNDQAILQRP